MYGSQNGGLLLYCTRKSKEKGVFKPFAFSLGHCLGIIYWYELIVELIVGLYSLIVVVNLCKICL